MLAPVFEGGEQAAHGALAHLVGARRTHQQRHQVALLNTQRLLVGAFGVIDRGLVQLALARHLIQGKCHQGAVVARLDAALLRHHDLVAIGQVVLQ